MNRETNRGPGRPSANVEQDARVALIDAAADRFAEQGFEATSLRAVATDAGVTPAMISYYFDDKAGLLQAVVVEGFERILATLRAALVRDDVPGDDRADALIPRFIGAYLRVLNRDPWIPKIIVREVISKDGPLRRLFVERFASQALALLPPEFAREIESGRLRGDLDPRFAILSIVGMCMFPYIAQPVLGPLFGYDLTDEFGEDYSQHAIRLFLEGAGGQQ